ncbi:rhomboid family intramembrane serine protease [Sphingomonas sp. KR1UV-12]|uniref:Rhomboid family intramembrane serine protease n=1 Tax=Sphingomonas aurea TaxID=3063994 RepID=A0ABT9EGU1_9SPHN|nr:rhomboid family intramembrane serine protease [Sphingomonas sp. KR1UV-12]MDP1026060.1 rhomboid family intramembrane serine protease [Sphingomonas sp. KR1UV-12]
MEVLRTAPVTTVVAALTATVSLLLVITGTLPVAAIAAGFVPARLTGAVPIGVPLLVPSALTPLTATLIHGGIAHLLLNLVVLCFCGPRLEQALGGRSMALLYVLGAYAAAAAQYGTDPLSPQPMIGASGAISAVIGAYALLFAERRPRRWGPISGHALHVAWLAATWIGIQLLTGYAGMGGVDIAIGAHIGGFAIGLLLARPLLRWRYRRA